MKTIQKLFTAAVLPALFVATTLFTGCEKENITPESSSETEQQLLPGKFMRKVTLIDGENTVILGIASDDKDALDAAEANFTMVAFAEKPQDGILEGSDALQSTEELAPAIDAPTLSIMVIEQHLAPGIQGFALNMKAPVATGKTDAYAHAYGNADFFSMAAPHQFYANGVGGRTMNCYYYFKYNNGTIWNHYRNDLNTTVSHMVDHNMYNNNIDMCLKVRNCNNYTVTWY